MHWPSVVETNCGKGKGERKWRDCLSRRTVAYPWVLLQFHPTFTSPIVMNDSRGLQHTVYSCVNMIIIPTLPSFMPPFLADIAQRARLIYLSVSAESESLYPSLTLSLQPSLVLRLRRGSIVCNRSWWLVNCRVPVHPLQYGPAKSWCLVHRTMAMIILILITPCLHLQGMILWVRYLAFPDF